MKKGFHAPIEMQTTANDDFRHVLYTGEHMQLVLMSLLPGEDIGLETHTENDQFFRFESGEGTVTVGETSYQVVDGDVVVVPAGTPHNVTNRGSGALKFYTIYAPSHHKDGIVRHTKEEAQAQEEEFDGQTSE